MHADPRFARLEESFAPHTPLAVPVHYTGFVTAGRRGTHRPRTGLRRDGCACRPAAGWSAGRCSPSLSKPRRRCSTSSACDTTIVTGPFLPAEALAELDGRRRAHARVHRASDPCRDLGAEMAASAVSVSQCGYNTAMDVLAARTPAVVVPYAAGREDEQLRRARRLEALGAVTLLDADRAVGAGPRRRRPARSTGRTRRGDRARASTARTCTAELVASMLAVGADGRRRGRR